MAVNPILGRKVKRPQNNWHQVWLCISPDEAFITAGLESDDDLYYPALAQLIGGKWGVTNTGKVGYETAEAAKAALAKAMPHLPVWVDGDRYEYPELKGRFRQVKKVDMDYQGRIAKKGTVNTSRSGIKPATYIENDQGMRKHG